GTGCWAASEPAMPSTKIIGRNRPASMASPSAVLYQSVFTPIPANAEPLLLAAEVNAYSTSASPCGPVLSIPARSPGSAIASPVPTSTTTGMVRKYSEANFTSRAPIFLPRYSGVRPTISPATNTVSTASTRIPYSPEPVPPGATSPSIMLTSSTAPPRLVYESWKESTDPVEVSVVELANSAEFGTPNRVSVPSVAAPTATGTVPWWASCAPWTAAQLPTARTAITATIAYPCRGWPTIRPNVRGSEKPIASSRKISIQLVQEVGFSNGWDELAL